MNISSVARPAACTAGLFDWVKMEDIIDVVPVIIVDPAFIYAF